MYIQERIDAFANLGNVILNGKNDLFEPLNIAMCQAHIENPWFTANFCQQALASIATNWLSTENLNSWISKYPILEHNEISKRIAVIMAGNIPFVGFHDLLCVLLSGHTFIGKSSSKDGGLMKALIGVLESIEPRFKEKIILSHEKLPPFDAVIATGSDNSSRYFDYYFGKYPHLIRKNRSSIAVLNGSESDLELSCLAHDIFSHFGLGCRNVSLLLLPNGYQLPQLLPYFDCYGFIANHNKYFNNYEYNRALYLMNHIPHFDNGFCIFIQNDLVGSPVGVTHYAFYNNTKDVMLFINNNLHRIQCVVENNGLIENAVPIGKAQHHSLTDYADGVDTMNFLVNIPLL